MTILAGPSTYWAWNFVPSPSRFKAALRPGGAADGLNFLRQASENM
jgi:hypothetical protein